MNKMILKAVEVDANGNELATKIISSKEILPPRDCSNFGYNQQEQLKIMEQAQQTLLDTQADFLKSNCHLNMKSFLTKLKKNYGFGKQMLH